MKLRQRLLQQSQHHPFLKHRNHLQLNLSQVINESFDLIKKSKILKIRSWLNFVSRWTTHWIQMIDIELTKNILLCLFWDKRHGHKWIWTFVMVFSFCKKKILSRLQLLIHHSSTEPEPEPEPEPIPEPPKGRFDLTSAYIMYN